MRKLIRQRLPEIIFFCITFAVISVILHSQYRLFSGVLEKLLLNFGLHFSYWSGPYRSCAFLLTDIILTVPVFFISRFACGIYITSGKRKLIPLIVPAVLSLVLLAVLCELQIFRRDDFWEVQYSKDFGFFKFMAYVMQQEGGRFFSYILKAFNVFFRTAPASMLYMNTCLFISIFSLFMGISRLLLFFLSTSASADRSVSQKKMAFFSAFSLFTAFIFTSPKIWEDWFWDAAGLIFGIGISLSVWSFALIMEDITFHPDQRKKVILPSLVLFITCGCNQISTIAIDILITEALLYVFLTRRNLMIRRRIIFYFFVTMAASVICLLSPGNFYRLEKGSFDFHGISEVWATLGQMIVRLYQQITVNIVMMKDYWLILIIFCLFFGSMITLRNRRKIIILALAMIPAGFFSLTINCVIDYMPARIYAAAFIWIAFSAALLSITAGSLCHDLLSRSVLPVRIQSAYIFLAVLVSFCSVLFLYLENHQLLQDIRSAWFYRDEQIRSIPAGKEQTRGICGVPVIGTNGTDIKLAEAFIANYYGLGWVDDTGVCPPFISDSDDPSLWR